MNTQLVESLAETIRNLSTAEQNALWQKLDHIPTTENILLQKIAETLPTTIQQRYNELRAKLQAETLTPEEHQELLDLINIVEQFDADRLQHLVDLANLRQISLPELLNQLKISPPAVYA
jgi:DNA-directed RNA polymerase subunit F